MDPISSRSNKKVKAARALRRRKERQASGAFLVEGIRHVGEAAEAAKASPRSPQIDSLFYAPDLLTSDFALELIAGLERRGVPCYATTADVFDSLADKDNPQGLIAVVRQPSTGLNDLQPEDFPWGVALVSPQDPGNLGTILRTIDAVGASGLVLLENSVDPYHPNAVRASMGALFWHPVVQASFDEFAAWSKRYSYHIYGTSAHATQDYRDLSAYRSPRILLMGSEREGLTPEQAAICDAMLSLPMRGHATSLNLAIATGVLLYAMLDRDATS